MKKGYRVLIALLSLAVLFIMAMIFYFSAENGAESTATSNGVTAFVLKIVKPDLETMSAAERAEFFSAASHYVRKAAHFTEYFFLGLFSSLLIFVVAKTIGKKIDLIFVIPIVFSFLYALFDEGHQTFVGGRAGQFTDVLIDTAGATMATIVVFLFYLSAKRKGRIG